jgi:hypothetical protein
LLKNVVDLEQFELGEEKVRSRNKESLDEKDVLVLPGFLMPVAIASIQKREKQQTVNVFLDLSATVDV